MDKKQHFESQILLDLLSASDGEGPVPTILTAHLFSACQHTFQRVYHNFPEKDQEDLFVEAFAELLLKIEEEPKRYSTELPFSHYFLEQYIETLSESKLFTPELNWKIVTDRDDFDAFKHLEAKVLFELLHKKYKPAEEKIYQILRRPLLGILQYKYYFTKIDPEVIYNEAIADGIDYIRQGKMDGQITTGLLTFFTRIGRNKLLNIDKSASKRKEQLTETGDEIDQVSGNSGKEEDTYFEGLMQRIKLIERSGIGTAKELIGRLLDCVGSPHNRYLEMFFLRRMNYDTMAEMLAEEGNPKKTGALRKGVYDGLKKARKCLNLN